ncbi:MAG: lipoprotein LpqH [Mycobacterium sp.]
MRTRGRLLASALTCTVLIAAYQIETTNARAVSTEGKAAAISKSAGAANTADDSPTLAPGEFRFTTGLDREPQHIQGPVTCDTRDDTYRIKIGDPDANGVEIGLSLDESSLKYVDLGNRGGIYYALFNDGEDVINGGPAPAPGTVHKTGNTYVVSGYATGTTANQHSTGLYFEIAVACP